MKLYKTTSGYITERNMDGTGPEGKGPKTGRGKGKCDEEGDYKEFFKKTLEKFAKKFGKKADINDFSEKEKKEFYDYVDKNWEGEKE